MKDLVKKKLARAFGLDQHLLIVELPGIEPGALPGLLPSELPVRCVSFRFSTRSLPADSVSGLDGVKGFRRGTSLSRARDATTPVRRCSARRPPNERGGGLGRGVVFGEGSLDGCIGAEKLRVARVTQTNPAATATATPELLGRRVYPRRSISRGRLPGHWCQRRSPRAGTARAGRTMPPSARSSPLRPRPSAPRFRGCIRPCLLRRNRAS